MMPDGTPTTISVGYGPVFQYCWPKPLHKQLLPFYFNSLSLEI